MTDATTVLMMTCPEIKHFVWIRYNPDKFTKDDKVVYVTKELRQNRLLELINTYQPTKQMEILYMYYSSENTDEGNHELLIFDMADFPQTLRPLCTIIE